MARNQQVVDEHTVKVIMCAECNSPTITTPKDGWYCMKCEFYPSMQDTYIQMVTLPDA